MNDPYDWDGPHEPIVASTEADMDAALTMQLFKLISGQPVLFSDVRHYDDKDKVWYFSNSGTHATFFAGRSYDPAVNLKHVSFFRGAKVKLLPSRRWMMTLPVASALSRTLASFCLASE